MTKTYAEEFEELHKRVDELKRAMLERPVIRWIKKKMDKLLKVDTSVSS